MYPQLKKISKGNFRRSINYQILYNTRNGYKIGKIIGSSKTGKTIYVLDNYKKKLCLETVSRNIYKIF